MTARAPAPPLPTAAEPGTAPSGARLRRGRAPGGSLCILDRRHPGIAPGSILRTLEDALSGRGGYLNRGRNSICYRTTLENEHGAREEVLLKEPALDGYRTNPDATFAGEARMLATLSGLAARGIPRLVARVRYGATHYLIATFVAGDCPDPLRNPLSRARLDDLVWKLFLLDREGFIHYDLQAPNILLCGSEAGLIDFEFAGRADPCAVYGPEAGRASEDYNVSDNPHYPVRSCICNFEFRTVYPYMEALGATRSAQAAGRFFRSYLGSKARYREYARGHFETLLRTRAGDIGRGSGRDPGYVASELGKAIAYEGVLERVLENPAPDVLAMEYGVMRYRYLLFHRDYNGAPADMRGEYRKFAGMACRARAACGAGDRLRAAYFCGAMEILRRLRRKAESRPRGAPQGAPDGTGAADGSFSPARLPRTVL